MAYLFLLCILMFFEGSIFAQEDLSSRFSIKLGLGAEKVGMPFREMFDLPVHSAFYFGVERKWSKQESKPGYQSIDVYLFSNYSAGLGNSIQTSYGLKIKLLKDLFINPSGGIGVIHLFRPKDSYYLENGSYKLYDDRGIARPEIHIGIKLGYSLGKIDVFGSYQSGLMYRYGWDIDILPRNFLILGMRYNIDKPSGNRGLKQQRTFVQSSGNRRLPYPQTMAQLE